VTISTDFTGSCKSNDQDHDSPDIPNIEVKYKTKNYIHCAYKKVMIKKDIALSKWMSFSLKKSMI